MLNPRANPDGHQQPTDRCPNQEHALNMLMRTFSFPFQPHAGTNVLRFACILVKACSLYSCAGLRPWRPWRNARPSPERRNRAARRCYTIGAKTHKMYESAVMTQPRPRCTPALLHAMAQLRPPSHQLRTARARRCGSVAPAPSPRSRRKLLPMWCDRAGPLACPASLPMQWQTPRHCAPQRSWGERAPHVVLDPQVDQVRRM